MRGVQNIITIIPGFGIMRLTVTGNNIKHHWLIYITGILLLATFIPAMNTSMAETIDHGTFPSSSDDANMQSSSQENEGILKGEGFTHSVLLELFVTTWCDRCPISEEASMELNMEYNQNFHYISMICDVNDEADQRSEDYLVETYPTAIFDGGDEDDRDSENDTSGTDDKERYEDAIETCGNRDTSATPIDLSVDVSDSGDGRVQVSYSATYTGNSAWFDGHIRVYVVEQISRYMNVDDEPIPNGFLGYAFDEDVTLYTQVEQTDQMTFDTDGGEFDNIIVIAGMFDKRTGIEGYTVQTASTEEYGSVQLTNIEHSPEHPRHNKKVKVSCEAIGDIERMIVEVAPCTADSCNVPQEVEMELIAGNPWEADIGKFDTKITIVHYKIKVTDSAGQNSSSPTYEFDFDDSDDDDETDPILLYGGGSVAVLAIVGGVLYFTVLKKGNGKKEEPW